MISEVSKLGATGLLAIAVIILWRKVQEKDTVLMQVYRSSIESATASAANLQKMSETLDKMNETLDKMSTAREILNKHK